MNRRFGAAVRQISPSKEEPQRSGRLPTTINISRSMRLNIPGLCLLADKASAASGAVLGWLGGMKRSRSLGGRTSLSRVDTVKGVVFGSIDSFTLFAVCYHLC